MDHRPEQQSDQESEGEDPEKPGPEHEAPWWWPIMTRDESVDPKTMKRIVKKDLGLTPLKKVHTQLLSDMTKVKRLERSRILLKEIWGGMMGPIIWTDEKLFTVEAIHNVQNDCVLAKSTEEIPTKFRVGTRCQKPPNVMHWAGVTCNGKKTPLIFIEEGVKVLFHKLFFKK